MSAVVDGTVYENPHTPYIRKRIEAVNKSNKWEGVYYVNTTHDDFISTFNSNVFTNLVQFTFAKGYVKLQSCEDCGKAAQERCHGVGDERPVLLRRALERVYPDTTQTIQLKTIVIAFLEEHIPTKFTFKCVECHKKETKALFESKAAARKVDALALQLANTKIAATAA